MSKKKRQNSDNELDQEFGLDEDMASESMNEEDDDNDENESDDVFAEDESDLELLRKLEEEDRTKALSAFSFAEEIGFNPYFDWTTIPEAEANTFRAMKEDSADKIEALPWKRYDLFKRWMVASVALDRGMHALFREIANSIINARKKADELCYEDIYLEVVRDCVETEEFDAAKAALEQFAQAFPHEEDGLWRVSALLAFAQGDDSTGEEFVDKLVHAKFNQHIAGFEKDSAGAGFENQTSHVYYEMADALYGLRIPSIEPRAQKYLEKARGYAELNNDDDLVMTIDNLKARILKQKIPSVI